MFKHYMTVFLLVQDLNKCKQFLPFLQRAGKTEAVVEFVASGSRVRLYLPKETCLTTFLISGTLQQCTTLYVINSLAIMPLMWEENVQNKFATLIRGHHAKEKCITVT